MSHPTVDVLVIGAGVTGLAIAGQLARSDRTVCIVDRHRRAGMETSTHNSGVIHAGLYYPPDTLKAQLCVEGARQLYAFCAAHAVPHDRCGKLVVASSESDVPGLHALAALGSTNGALGLEIVDTVFIGKREPRIRANAALWSPDTGRVETESLVRALLGVAEARGAVLLPQSTVIAGVEQRGVLEVALEREVIAARAVVNAAGLYADDVSAVLGGEVFTIYPCRGEYAELKPSRRHWINGLVYPLPDPSGHGLGTHLTRTVGGSLLLGPTIRYQDRKGDYEGDRLPLDAFVEPARLLMPDVTLEDLTYGGSGIRPKLHPASQRFADFLIRPDRNQPRLVHAAGMDSPGLTSCLAVGARVARLVGEILA